MTRETRNVFVAPIEQMEWRASNASAKEMTVAGHAAVFNRLSLDLGGFREKIAPGAFTDVLDQNPDVHLLWDHSTSLVLARTRNKTLDLREDPQGLHFWSRVADTSYSRDLRILMERGDVDQASFAFTIAEDGATWFVDEDENVLRTITHVGDLYDVTVTAQGAYPQTDSAVRSLRQALAAHAIEGLSEDRYAELAREYAPSSTTQVWMPSTASSTSDVLSLTWFDPKTSSRSADEEPDAAPAESADVEVPDPPQEPEPVSSDLDGEEERSAAPDTADAVAMLEELKERSKAARQEARESYLRLLKDNGLPAPRLG